MNQVIASVHALIPLFTPTTAQISKVGNEVCTAFDQGKTVAQVKATAMQMAGRLCRAYSRQCGHLGGAHDRHPLLSRLHLQAGLTGTPED